MSGAKKVTIRVHRDAPACCRSTLHSFAIVDWPYHGDGEPGDTVRCGCGNWLIYSHRGWRIRDQEEAAR